jgi:hypothetical protein
MVGRIAERAQPLTLAWRARVHLAGVLLLTMSCGGDSPTGTGGQNSAPLKATIDGQAWVAGFASATAGANGIFTITGSSLNASVTGMSLVLYYIGAPGTYPLGVGGSVKGGIGVLSGGGSSWATALTGAAGSVTISNVSATRIAGTFSFTAPPQAGAGATTTRSVTQGEFDLPVTGPATLNVPDNLGSLVTATFGGNAFNASTVVQVTSPSSGTLTMGASNTAYTMNVVLSGYTGAGTYTMGTGAARTVSVITTATPQSSWGGTQGTTSGTIVITSATSSRIKGTMNLVLSPSIASPGPGQLTVTGNFELGIP